MYGFWLHSFAQNVTNITATQVGKNIHVSYDLDEESDVLIYVSTDGGKTFSDPLKQVSGDVGENINPGHKTIVWDVLAEQENLEGDEIVFQVEATGVSKKNLTFTVNGVSFKMVYVKGGTFTMGCTSEQGRDCKSDEKPAHQVTLSDYYMGETEVTQALWQAVMGNNPSSFKGENLPVEYVSWDDCQKFIQKLNSLTGKNFRLPTEAEWEYAARGGVKNRGYKYSGSINFIDVAWYWQNSGDIFLKGTDDNWSWEKIGKNNGRIHPVKSKLPNELGLYDMSGNVWEWCSDWYSSSYYESSSSNNPTGPTTGSSRVLRGGSWYSSAESCRVARRNDHRPDDGNYIFGFRLSLVQQ